MLRKICAVFSDGRTVLLLTPGTGNMQACLRHQATRDTIRRRRQVTKLPKPIPQHPPFSQRYRFLRMRCCVLALPMPFTRQGALGLRCDRGRMTSGMSSFLAGRHSQAFFASALCRSNAVTCILNMNRISPVIFQGASVTFEILIQSSRQQLISL